MNTDQTINVMEVLRDPDLPCPCCLRVYPKHETICTFIDFKFTEVLLELYTNPNIDTSSIKADLYEFIDDRSGKEMFFDAIGYVLTNDILYKDTGINEEDIIYFSSQNENRENEIQIRLNTKFFFQNKNDSNIEKVETCISALELLRDIQNSLIGQYSTTFDVEIQKNVFDLIRLYMIDWLP